LEAIVHHDDKRGEREREGKTVAAVADDEKTSEPENVGWCADKVILFYVTGNNCLQVPRPLIRQNHFID